MRRFALACTLALIGCNGSSTTSDPNGPLPPPPAGEGLQFQMLSTLQPGQEIERCQLFQAPAEGLWINREDVRYSAGSHHVLLYATSYASFPMMDRHGRMVQPGVVYDCPDGAPADFDITSVVAGAQSANAANVIDLPSDAAVKVAPNTVLVMNTHYLNASPKQIDTDARINVYTVPAAQVKHEAGIIFFYDPIIRVPALSSAQARMACPVNREYTVFNLQTHMHKRGLGGLANLVDKDGNVIQELYRSESWEDVPVKQFDPGMVIEPGQMLDYRCNYQNNEDRTVLQGLTTKDEMCMLIGAYYPRNAPFEYCSPDGSTGAKGFAATFIGSGATSCMQSVSCLEAARGLPSGDMQDEAVYRCILDSCEKVARPFNDAVRCEVIEAEGSCKSQCSGDGLSSDACTTCIHSACATELSTCQASACQ